MQSLRCFRQCQKLFLLSGSGALFNSRSFGSSHPMHRLKLSDQPKSSFDSADQGGKEAYRSWSAPGDSSETLTAWTSYDGYTEGKRNESGEDTSGDEDTPTVTTYFDPLEGNIITRPVVEESGVERRDQVEANLEYESNEKKTSGEETRFSNSPRAESEANRFSLGSSAIVRRKTGKAKVSWVCDNCGAVHAKWWGICKSCDTANSLKSFIESETSRVRGSDVSEAVLRPWLHQQLSMSAPISLADVNLGRTQSEWRIPLSGHFGMEVSMVLGGIYPSVSTLGYIFSRSGHFGMEVSMVLGGGVVPGSLILIGGDPGVGKSTLLLQIAAILSQGLNFKGPAPVVYVSGEESIEQIRSRADHMTITSEELFLYSSTDIEDILEKVQNLSPQALIVDSIQTVYLKGINGSAGNTIQVKECTSALMQYAKHTSIPVFLIGHVTKSGEIAGPHLLEHMVDVVLYMEGERYSSYWLLRSVKNRFGSTDELGVFEMSESGLQAVLNPSEIFLSDNFSDSEVLVGLAVAVVINGSRTFLLEIQALCVTDALSTKRINGIQTSRAEMIIAVLMKQAGLKLQDSVIFLNVVSGFKLTETAGDLAIAAAICSRFCNVHPNASLSFPSLIGQVGLGGELRSVPRMDKRVVAVAKLGFRRCIIPKTAEKSLKALNLEMEILGCKNLKEVIDAVFRVD